jgi:hypothetical protein
MRVLVMAQESAASTQMPSIRHQPINSNQQKETQFTPYPSPFFCIETRSNSHHKNGKYISHKIQNDFT